MKVCANFLGWGRGIKLSDSKYQKPEGIGIFEQHLFFLPNSDVFTNYNFLRQRYQHISTGDKCFWWKEQNS